MDHYCLRYSFYMNAEWSIQNISLDDCGVWPGMSKLPIEITSGSAKETADHIKDILNNKQRKLSWKNYRALYIEHIKKYTEVIARHVSIIVLEGGVIRKKRINKIFKYTSYIPL